jgi:glycosyltransferase involved in cell wall biosynthesis
MPKVSVIIITYNRADLLSRAINSVLFQDYQDFELLIIDDASTDNTSEIVRAFNDNRIKYYLNEKNLGIAKSRNKGISLAVGEYIAMLDSDDYWISRDIN